MMSPKASDKPVGLKGSEKVLGPNSEHKYFRRFKAGVQSPAPRELGVMAHAYNPNT